VVVVVVVVVVDDDDIMGGDCAEVSQTCLPSYSQRATLLIVHSLSNRRCSRVLESFMIHFNFRVSNIPLSRCMYF